MKYLTTEEAADKWGISPRRVRILLSEDRVLGAIKQGGVWLIPDNAAKPSQKTSKKQCELPPEKDLTPASFNAQEQSDLYQEVLEIVSAVSQFPGKDPDQFLASNKEERIRPHLESSLAYLRGDFKQVLACYDQASNDTALQLCLTSITTSAAISIGDFKRFQEINNYLTETYNKTSDENLKVLLEYGLSSARFHVHAFDNFPSWIKEGSFDRLPVVMRPDAVYRRIAYMLSTGTFSEMNEIAKTAHMLIGEGTNLSLSIYLLIISAFGSFVQQQSEEAQSYLVQAMHLGLPYGFITPFAEYTQAFCGLMERCLEAVFPEYLEPIVGQWNDNFKHFVFFHNRLSGGKLTDQLTLREYQISVLAHAKVPYAAIARLQSISEGRVNNILQGVYRKLGITRRDQLGDFVL